MPSWAKMIVWLSAVPYTSMVVLFTVQYGLTHTKVRTIMVHSTGHLSYFLFYN
jgi:hypothetical protein